MTFLLRRWHGRWEVAERCGGSVGPEQARAIVEAWVADPGALEALRALLDPVTVHRLRDDELVDEVARRIAAGEILLLEQRLPRPAAMPDEAPAEEQPREEQAAPEPAPALAPPEPEAPAVCTNPACRDAFARAAETGTALVSTAGC